MLISAATVLESCSPVCLQFTALTAFIPPSTIHFMFFLYISNLCCSLHAKEAVFGGCLFLLWFGNTQDSAFLLDLWGCVPLIIMWLLSSVLSSVFALYLLYCLTKNCVPRFPSRETIWMHWINHFMKLHPFSFELLLSFVLLLFNCSHKHPIVLHLPTSCQSPVVLTSCAISSTAVRTRCSGVFPGARQPSHAEAQIVKQTVNLLFLFIKYF